MYYSCPQLSSIPIISHGFFTRNGGVSEGIYASLNCGYGSGDAAEKVSENRRRVAEAIGADGLCTVHQIHSNKSVIVNEPLEHKSAPQADALVTNKSGVALGVLTADCLPVLFADGKNGVIAAAHSGWKGAISGVLENTIMQMCALGAEITHINATIGPAIARESYEVGTEFIERFISQHKDNERFFAKSENPGHYMFNLSGYASNRLMEAGLSRINIIAQDTYFNDNEFFSYRRSCKRGEPVYGRQISVIMLKNG
jgi:YfiH family protein